VDYFRLAPAATGSGFEGEMVVVVGVSEVVGLTKSAQRSSIFLELNKLKVCCTKITYFVGSLGFVAAVSSSLLIKKASFSFSGGAFSGGA
jgi:hypothetical protein